MGDGDGKRRLPVLKSPDSDEEKRPAAQWIAIGGVATFIAWYPLAMLAQAWAKSSVAGLAPGDNPEATRDAFLALSPGERMWLSVVVVVGPMVALAVAALLGGLLVGRFGGDAGKKEGMLAAIGAAIIASLISAAQMIPAGQGGLWLMSAVIITVLAGLAGRGGAALGLRMRG
jgi:hypothetical protein